MKLIETQYRPDLINQIREEMPFFMDYMSDIVENLIQGKIGLRTFDMLYQDTYLKAEADSRAIDRRYERGDYGRPGIMDGGPDYISSFATDRERCLNILREKNIPLNII